jgi:aryl-alcohol dehydrogenase-like predicted oxidoreductase
MKYNNLGKSDVKVTEITFGAWAIGGWMWGGADEKQAKEAILKAYDLGITSFDTAPVYGFGKSEEIVGDTLKDIPRDKVQILTKYGMRWDTSRGDFAFDTKDNDGNPVQLRKYASKQSVINECEDSLRRLKTDYIDLYQIHWPDSTTPVRETMEAVQKLLEQGKIRAAGVCNYSVDLMEKAEDILHLASNQVPYSMVRRDIEKDVVPYCVNNEIGIIAYSPLQRGILTGKMHKDYTFNEGDTRPNSAFYQEPNFSRINDFLDDIKEIAENHQCTLAQLVIQWTLLRKGISCVLVGARNSQQVTDNAKAAELKLEKSEIELINSKLNTLNLEI